jgi:hypothetical protein
MLLYTLLLLTSEYSLTFATLLISTLLQMQTAARQG